MKTLDEVAKEMKNKGYHVDDEALIRYISDNYKLIKNESE